MAADEPLRVFLWIVPRTNSTVFTKCMSFVDDTEVWMEPYMCCSMNETLYNPEWGVSNPVVVKMRQTLQGFTENPEFVEMKKQEVERMRKYPNIWEKEYFRYSWLKEQLQLKPSNKRLVFIKDQSFAIYDKLEYLPQVPSRHVFLIRHPAEVYPSFKHFTTNLTNFSQMPWDETDVEEPTPYIPVKELYKIQRDLWRRVKESNIDPDPIVIDGYDLASKPEIILPKFFEKLGIPYKDSYLTWESDPELVYSSWKGSGDTVFIASKTPATSRAVESSCFVPPKLPRGTCKPEWKLTKDLVECIDYSMPFYNEMYDSTSRLT